MQMPSVRPQTAMPPTVDPIHQAYITHCLFDEGVYQQAGFTVRASSTRDPLLLRLAQEYPAYESPPGLTFRDGSPPVLRRLALVHLPNGRKALIHSVPLPDRHGRANNFFSHCLFSPTLGPRQALASWGSPDWATDCAADMGKDLDPLSALPGEGLLQDEVVTAFLQPEDTGGEGSSHWPSRLTDPQQRRELLAWTLRACLLVLQAEPGTSRNRLYLLAEPELTALLLYGVVRLLPPALATDLTFSTYEPARHTLRTYRHAQVVGTWTANPQEGLEGEFFTVRGYALDTFNHRCSRELNEASDTELGDWIEQAARGEWKVLDKIHSLLGKTTTAIPLREGFEAARLVHRLVSGKSSAEDLLVLKRSPWAAGLLREHHHKLWPLILEQSRTDEQTREAFSDVLADNVQELEQQVAEALHADPPGDWQGGWRLLEQALAGNPARLLETLQRILPLPPYPPGLRVALLQEVQKAQLSPLNQQQPLYGLLRRCTAAELEQLAGTKLPREWFVWALCYAVITPSTRQEAVRHLQGSDNQLLGLFWEQINLIKDEQQRQSILAPLLVGRDERARLFFGRSLQLGCPIRPETLLWVLETLGAQKPDWSGFWCEPDHLPRLLEVLRQAGEVVQPLWDHFSSQLDSDLLLLANPYQTLLLTNLGALRDRPGSTLPPALDQLIADWVLLREHFEKASAVSDAARQEILAACARRKVDAVSLLRTYFQRYVLPQELTPNLLDDFAGFFHSFYQAGHEHQRYSSRFLGWMEIVRVCPEPTRRAEYRSYYLERHVPEAFRARLIEEAPPTEEAAGEGEPSPAGSQEQPATLLVHDPFPLTGVRPGGGVSAGLVPLWRGAPWLLCAVFSGLAALLLFSTFPLPPRQLALWYLFVPLVLALADGVALQAAALSLGAPGRGLLQRLGVGLVGGGSVGVVSGLLAAAVAFAWGSPSALVWCLGGAVAGGMLAATILGFTLPLLLSAGRIGARVASAPIVRAMAGVAAVGLYLLLARWLLR
jgi:hypothetical protein